MKPKDLTAVFQGFHNQNIDSARDRLIRGGTYKDLSTVCIVPIRGPQQCSCGCGRVSFPGFHPKIVQCWLNMMTPMNQKFMRVFVENMEVGEAYNAGVKMVLTNPELSKWKYVLTLEEDNMPPPDGLLKLLENMDKFDAIGGLYWTKGEGGQPMCYGDPGVIPKNFIPQLPPLDSIKPCNGLGMGFTLFKMDLFRKMPEPWFKTIQEYQPGVGAKGFTQDLWFFENAGRAGFKFACDSRVKVGHLDVQSGMVW